MRQPYTDLRAHERFTAYVANEAFYNGDPGAQLTMLSNPKRDEVRAVFNYARDILNKHAAATVNGLACRVIGAAETSTTLAGEPDPGLLARRETPAVSLAQAELDEALRHSGAFSTDFAAALNACILGDGAFYISHLNGRVFYRAIHPGDLDVLDWSADGRPARVMVQHDDRIEVWTDELVLIDAQESEIFLNPYGVIPVVIFPNWPRPGSRWGDSTLEHIKAACRLLNERIDLLMWLVRVQGNPPIKALGVETTALRTDPGEIWSAPADAQIELVKLLDAETAGIHIGTINLLLQMVKELSNTPSVAYGIGNTELSGRALELSYMPMTQAANIRRGFFGEAVRQRNRIILRMAEVLHSLDLAGCYETSVTFAPVTPEANR